MGGWGSGLLLTMPPQPFWLSATEIDASFSLDEAKANPDVVAAFATFNSQLPPSNVLDKEAYRAYFLACPCFLLDRTSNNPGSTGQFFQNCGSVGRLTCSTTSSSVPAPALGG